MAQMKLVFPETGNKDTVAEPRVTTALEAIQSYVNGAELATASNNFKAGGIEEASLSTGVVEKLTTKIGLSLEKVNASNTAVAEKLYEQEKSGATTTLPAATLNRMVGVYNASAGAIKVKTAAGVIAGDFLTAAGEIELMTAQHILLQADGTNWIIVAGEPRRTQTYARTLRAIGAAFEPSATRPSYVNVEAVATNNESAFLRVRETSAVGTILGLQNVGGITGTVPALTISAYCLPAMKLFCEGGNITTLTSVQLTL